MASFLRTSDGLSLTLESPNWKLDRGKNYSVLMKAGAASWNTDVAAEANSVSVPISDKKFIEGLRAANVFMVDGAGSTIRIPLDQSRAALDRLDNWHWKPTHLWPHLGNRNIHRSPLPTVSNWCRLSPTSVDTAYATRLCGVCAWGICGLRR